MPGQIKNQRGFSPLIFARTMNESFIYIHIIALITKERNTL